MVINRKAPAGTRRRPTASEAGRWASLGLAQLPFQAELSLEPLIAFWRSGELGPLEGLREKVERALQTAPALAATVDDPATLSAHRDLLDLLMLPAFPPALRDRDLTAALIPFEFRAFYATPGFDQLLTQENGTLSGRVNLDVRTFTYGKVLSAYLHVLRTVYGIELPLEYPLILTTQDAQTGLDRHFKIDTDLRFMEVRTAGAPPPFTPDSERILMANLSDLSVWKRLLPPDRFSFRGFSIIQAHDITDQRLVSSLERDLVEDDHLLSGQKMAVLENRLRALLRQRDIRLGISMIDDDELFILHEPGHYGPGLFTRSRRFPMADAETSLFGRCLRERRIQVVEDLAGLDAPAAIETALMEAGVRNVAAAPLAVQGRSIGVLYLWSARPGTLNFLNVMKLAEVLPVFSVALRRSMAEMRREVQTVILGEYKAIHPAVEWRFRQAALNFIRAQQEGRPAEVEPIVFHDVYPLFGATDIRGSSTHRNEAVQHDLLEHLELAEDVIRLAREARPLPLFYHFLARITRIRASLREGLSSGDEGAAIEFLQRDFEPMLEHLRDLSPKVRRVVGAYKGAAEENGRLYRRTTAFDESVDRINQIVATYLDEEQHRVQPVFPHYFEKHQTDGVSFSIYAGSSLLEDGEFDQTNVQLLRLWQLMVMCGIIRRVDPVTADLPVPLDTTHLVLVQTTPISIRYRFDENRFDVDGPAHIRYEIMKQRVEKACLRGTEERVTQPGRVAIVYSQAREAAEYRRYIRYLQEAGYAAPNLEELELDDLQGMKGLKALRFAVPPGDVASGIDPLKLATMVAELTD